MQHYKHAKSFLKLIPLCLTALMICSPDLTIGNSDVHLPYILPVLAQKERESIALPHVIAHRGGRKWAPENTMAAFRKCLQNKIYGIELDIHRCSTGELVVIHDEEIARTTNGVGLVKNKSLTELRNLSAGKWFGEEFAGEKIPLLSEVLQLLKGQVFLNIEIKNCPINYPDIEIELAKLLKNYERPEQIMVSSFDHQVLRRFHKIAPQYQVGFLECGIPVVIGSYAQQIGARSWNPDFSMLRADAVSDAHQAGVQVNAWTVNRPDEWASAVNMKIDGIITDDPQGLTEFLDKVKR